MNRIFKLNLVVLIFFLSVTVLYSQAKPVKTGWNGDFFYIGEGFCKIPVGVVFKSATRVKQGDLLRVIFETKYDVNGVRLFLVPSGDLKNYRLDFLKRYFNVSGGNTKFYFSLYSSGFRVDRKLFSKAGANREVWVVLLGIPSFFRSGNYKLVLKGEVTGEYFFYIGSLSVTRAHFKFEKLFLNSDLTALKESKNPLIFKQSRKLIEILKKFDERKLFYVKEFSLPVKANRITSPFGERREYLYLDGKHERRIHNGIDFAVPVGTPVKACGDGEVVFSGDRIITGKSIVLEHMPGVYSIYYHLSKLFVKRGEIVKKGAVIGFSGMSGFATGPHLHWEIRVSGVAVNPECFLKQNIIDKTLFIDHINKPIK